MDYEKFYGKIIEVGNSLAITIPDNIVKGANYQKGNQLQIMIRKKTEE